VIASREGRPAHGALSSAGLLPRPSTWHRGAGRAACRSSLGASTTRRSRLPRVVRTPGLRAMAAGEERARPDVAPTLAFGRHAPLNDHGYRSLGGSRACPASASLRVHTSSGGTILLILMIDEADPRPLDLRDSRPISRPPYHSDRNRIEPTASGLPEQFRGDAGHPGRERSPLSKPRSSASDGSLRSSDRALASPPKGEAHAVVDVDHFACAVGDVDEHIHRS
jgi:hypothetical protein